MFNFIPVLKSFNNFIKQFLNHFKSLHIDENAEKSLIFSKL